MTVPRRWVIDASATIEYLLRSQRGVEVASALRASDFAPLHAPHLMVTESMSSVRGLVLGGHVDPSSAEIAVGELAEIPCTYWDPLPLTPRVWELRNNVSSYDATYVALAEALDDTLLTCDPRLASPTTATSEVRVNAI